MMIRLDRSTILDLAARGSSPKLPILLEFRPELGRSSRIRLCGSVCPPEGVLPHAGAPGRHGGRDHQRRSAGESRRPDQGSGPHLYSCSLVRLEADVRVVTFVAGVASGEPEFRRRLFERFGAVVAFSRDVRVGFDQYDPVAVTLVSERVADLLAVLAARPMSRGDDAFDVVLEHRTTL